MSEKKSFCQDVVIRLSRRDSQARVDIKFLNSLLINLKGDLTMSEVEANDFPSIYQVGEIQEGAVPESCLLY